MRAFRLALTPFQQPLAAASKYGFHPSCSHVHLPPLGSLASSSSSLVSSGSVSLPVRICLSSPSTCSSTSSCSFICSSKTTRCLPRLGTYVHSPVTLSTLSTRTRTRCSPDP